MSISNNNISGFKPQQSGIKDSMAGSEGSDNFKLFEKYSEQQKQNATRQKLSEIYPSSIANIREQSSDQNSSSEKESNKKNDDSIAINLVSNFDEVEVGKNEIENDANNVKNSVIEHPIEEQKNEIENIIKEVEVVTQEKNNDANENNKIPVENESKNVEQNNIPQIQVSQEQSSQTKKDEKQKNNSKNNLLTKDKTKQISKKDKKKEPKKNITKQRSNKINATSKDKATQRQQIIKNFKTTNHLKSRMIKDDQKQLQQYADTVLKERDKLIKKLQEQKNKLMMETPENRNNKIFSADGKRAKIRKNITQLEQLNQEMEKLKLDAKDGKYNYTFFPNTVKLHQLEKKRTAKPTVNTKKTVKKDSVLNKKKTGQVKITTTKIKKEPKQLGSKTFSNLNKIDKKEVISTEQNNDKMQKNFNKGTLPENTNKKQETIDLTGIDKRRQFDKSINMEWFSNERKGSMIQHENEFFGAIRKNFKKVELNEMASPKQQDNNLLLNARKNLKPVPPKAQTKVAVNNIEIIEEKKEEKKENNNIQVQKPQGKVDKKNNKTAVIKKNITKFSNKAKKHKITQYNNMGASNNINKNPKIILKPKNKVNGFGK